MTSSPSHLMLVVEDDEAIQELIVHSLEGAGYATICAGDGVAALEILRSRHVDGVLLDVNMPRMDGFSLLERMRGTGDMRAIPVLMLTAQSAPEDIRRAIQLGAIDYIGKPFEQRQLLRRVARMLARIERAA